MELIKNLIHDLKKENSYYGNSNILVTGGAGFIGSWLIDVLLKFGARVTCLDNYSSGLPQNISNHLKNENFRFLNHNVVFPYEFNEKFEVIFHFASRASPFEFSKFPLEILNANVIGTKNVLELTRKMESKLVFASTSEVYGDPNSKNIPTKEDYNGNVSPIGPRSCYDESKRVAESYIKAYNIQYAIDARIIRIFNTYGPRMRSGNIYGRVIPIFIEQALSGSPITVFGEGTQTRSFTYIIDEINGILRAGFVEDAKGKVINIGNNSEISILDLANKIKKLTNSTSKIVFHPLPIDDPKRRLPDITLAKKILSWEPKVQLDEGLLHTINYVT